MYAPISYAEHLFPNKVNSTKAHKPKIVDNNLSVALHPTPKLDDGGFYMTVDDLRAKVEPVAKALGVEQDEERKGKALQAMLHSANQNKEMYDYFQHANQKRRDDAREALIKKAQDDLERGGHNVPPEQVRERVERNMVDQSIQQTMERPPVTPVHNPTVNELLGQTTPVGLETPAQEEVYTQGYYSAQSGRSERSGRSRISQELRGQGLNLNYLLGGFPNAEVNINDTRLPLRPANPNIALPTEVRALYAQNQSNGGMAPIQSLTDLFGDVYNRLLRPAPVAQQQGLVLQRIAKDTTPLSLPAQSQSGADFRPKQTSPALALVKSPQGTPMQHPTREEILKMKQADLIKLFDREKASRRDLISNSHFKSRMGGDVIDAPRGAKINAQRNYLADVIHGKK